MTNLSVTEGDVGLQIVNLRKSYKKRTVIRDVTLRLNRGEVVALALPHRLVGVGVHSLSRQHLLFTGSHRRLSDRHSSLAFE